MKKRPYVGKNGNKLEFFSSDVTPTKELFPQYKAVIGPFRTKKAALFLMNNPMVQTVSDAERLAKNE